MARVVHHGGGALRGSAPHPGPPSRFLIAYHAGGPEAVVEQSSFLFAVPIIMPASWFLKSMEMRRKTRRNEHLRYIKLET